MERELILLDKIVKRMEIIHLQLEEEQRHKKIIHLH